MARFWVGPWVWETANGPSRYRAPTDTIRALDLRSDSQCGTPNTTNGNGLFVMPDAAAPGANYVEVPVNFTGSTRNAVRNKLQLAQVIVAPGRIGFVLELVTRHAVADGSTFCRPLMPNKQGRLRVSLDAIHEDIALDTSSAFWAKVQTCLQATYQRYRDAALAGTMPENFHRKYLSVLLEKFAGRISDYHLFIPTGLPDESPLPHSTTLTESFNKADNGLGPDQTWTELRGSWRVVSNQVCTDAASSDGSDSGEARADADLASDDHYAQLVRVTNPVTNFQGGGGYARVSSSANTGYAWLQRGDNTAGATASELFKIVAGTRTQLATATKAGTTNVVAKIEVNGSAITCYRGATTDISTTDTAITGNVRGGMHRYDNQAAGTTSLLFDAWEAADLAAAFVPFPHPRGLTGGMHDLSGGMQ